MERKKLWPYLLECVAYLWRGLCGLGRSLLLFLFAIAIICVFLYVAGWGEMQIRWTGMFLQLFGFGLVAWRLNKTRRLFDQPTRIQKIKEYFTGFPKRQIIHYTFHLQADSLSAGFPEMIVRMGPDINATHEARILLLEENTKSLFDQVGKLEKKLRTQSDDLKREIGDVATQQKAGTEDVFNTVKRAIVDGLDNEWLGVFFFAVGVILASASPEISDFLDNFGKGGS